MFKTSYFNFEKLFHLFIENIFGNLWFFHFTLSIYVYQTSWSWKDLTCSFIRDSKFNVSNCNWSDDPGRIAKILKCNLFNRRASRSLPPRATFWKPTLTGLGNKLKKIHKSKLGICIQLRVRRNPPVLIQWHYHTTLPLSFRVIFRYL